MNSGRYDEQVSAAVVAAETGAQAWRRVVHQQLAAAPAHADWYAVTGELVDMLRSLSGLVGVLSGQVAGYGQGRVLRDDAGMDPVVRLATAVRCAQELRALLDDAERAANLFWSQIGHVGVEVPR